ncbi:7-carboxy-7-deazaguanine synthase [Vibrio phage vB_VibM_83AMN]|nr:7-carboxy-7-deazaguanine synthase [Vibrio phage vB_VibM_83AMN]
MLKNQQQASPRSNSESLLLVHSIFYTIQGEGIYCGYPAVFVRLAGCNLQCPLCDTDYTNDSNWLTAYDVVKDCIAKHKANVNANQKLVVITGGEPFRQPKALGNLCVLLENEGFKIQIETNGTMAPPEILPQSVVIMCSPKTTKLNPKLEKRIDAYKYVIKSDDYNIVDGLPLRALDHKASPYIARPYNGFTGKVYVQPLDEQDAIKNAKHLKTAISVCQEFNYILQIQVHKLIGVE